MLNAKIAGKITCTESWFSISIFKRILESHTLTVYILTLMRKMLMQAFAKYIYKHQICIQSVYKARICLEDIKSQNMFSTKPFLDLPLKKSITMPNEKQAFHQF